MSHRHARLTVEGRRVLVRRVRVEGMPVAHVAAMMGISRQCAHRWLRRFDAEGDGGLADRSSRPRRCPRRTPALVEEQVLVARAELRVGPDGLADAVGVPARTISGILARHQVPRLAECDPLTGARIRATKQTAVRYEREHPGELVHIDVKKLGRIPPGAAGALTGAARPAPERASASTTCTPRWTITAAGPTARSSPTNAPRPPRGSSNAPPRRSPPPASTRSPRSLPTTTSATATAQLSPRSSPASTRATGSSNPTAPGKTAKSRDSTAPCSPNGPTASLGPATKNAPRP